MNVLNTVVFSMFKVFHKEKIFNILRNWRYVTEKENNLWLEESWVFFPLFHFMYV